MLGAIGGVLGLLVAVGACSRRDSAPASMADNKEGGTGTRAAAAPAPDAPKQAESKDGKKKEGEVTSWKRSQKTPNATRLLVGDKETLPLKGVEARVTIDGFRARVLLDYHFVNDQKRVLEGTFQVRLPEEASPYYFAFGESAWQASAGDAKLPFFSYERARELGSEPEVIARERQNVWLAPREARMVPRVAAAQAYDEAVRRRVDPALVEWQGAGVFSSRVYPLQPGKYQRIVLGYDADLTRLGPDLDYQLDLPPGLDASAVTVTVKNLPGVEVKAEPAVAPVKTESATHLRFEGAATVDVRLKRVGAVALTGTRGDQPYFAASVAPALRTVSAAGQSRAVFLLDTSLSSNPDRFNVWLKLLRALLEKNQGTIRQFAVAFFNAGVTWHEPRWVDNSPASVEALMKRCEGLALEGATDLGAALAAGAQPPWHKGSERFDLFLLSDGASTWGEGDPYALSRLVQSSPRAGSIFAYSTGLAGTDAAMLNHLTRETGGAVIALLGEQEVAATAVAHNQRPWRLKDVQVEGGSDLMLAGRPGVLFAGQRLLLVGRGAPKAGSRVAFTVEMNGKSETVSVPIEQAVPSLLASRVYGQVAVGQMEELLPATEQAARGYASHFRVTGQSASLLMLETEAEYARLKLDPAADAAAVAGQPASGLVAGALKSMAEALGDPRLGFVEMARGMKRPPVNLRLPAEIEKAIEGLPSERFAVSVPALAPRQIDRAGTPGELLELLSLHRPEYARLSDEADRRRRERSPDDGLVLLSSLVEENPGDAVLTRDVGYTATTWGLGGQGYYLFRRLARARPAEPLNYQAMARTLQTLGRNDLAMLTYELLLGGTWEHRYGDVRDIATVDYLRLLRRIASGKAEASLRDLAAQRLAALAPQASVKEADLVVMVGWNTGNSDVDLHVVEPSGEECFYGHRDTRSGGRITRDVTQGFGPEMYVLPHAPRGTYTIKAKYFTPQRDRMTAATKVQATVIRRYGTPEESVEERVVTLVEGKDMHEILVTEY